MITVFLSLAGLIVSAYALLVEYKLSKNPQYKPACDLSDRMSCTKPILSKYGRMFGFSNALLGIFFYAGMALIALLNMDRLVFAGAVIACVASLFFAWILYRKIKTVCLICNTIYLINGLLLVVSYFNL